MDQPSTEKRFHAPRGRVELGLMLGPHREIEAAVEESLGALGDAVLELERILQRDTAIRIAASAALFTGPHRRGELRDPPLEEGHRHLTWIRAKVQRDVEVAVECVQIAEPSGVQVRGVAHHGEGAREEPARRDEAGHLGDSGRGEKAREVREVVVIRDGLKSGHRIERASKELG